MKIKRVSYISNVNEDDICSVTYRGIVQLVE